MRAPGSAHDHDPGDAPSLRRRSRSTVGACLGRSTPVQIIAGESERQLRDVARILAVSGNSLDRAYLARWLRQLGLEEAFHRAEGLARGD